ncbi:MAG: peptide-binding protein [Hydrogenimonas sp.]|nr:peptide-binding protein [Hydrogenimonas sp.]
MERGQNVQNKHNVDEKKELKYLFLAIAAAYLFSIAIRMIWVDWASSFPEFYWNSQLMINTNDGYYFASGAQKELFGTLQHNPRVPDLWYTATVTLSYFAAKFLPFSLDSVILYMPAVVSSLVVVPIVLIGRLYEMTAVGFFAALLGSVTWSYYNRTMTGYYDTDMFSAMAPMFIVYFLMAANHKRSINYAFAAAIALLLYPYLYNQGKAMVFAISVIYIAYVWFKHKDEDFAYPSIAFVASVMIPVWWPLKLLLLIALYASIRLSLLNAIQIKYTAFGLTGAYLLFGDGFNFIYHKVINYIDRDSATSGLHFYNVVQTVREAGHIPFDIFAKRISGSVAGLFIALAGYVILLWRKPAFLITLPLMGLGLFAWWGGLRFTVYAVPVAAFSAVYLFYIIGSYIIKESYRPVFTAVATAAMLYPNITHVLDYKAQTVFNLHEVKVLDALKKIGSDKDYVIAWWDYGYPIWYYANKNTLIDGGKHSHDNFIVSQILTTDSQLQAARLSRVAVETYVNSEYKTVADTLFKNREPDQIDPNEYLNMLKEDEDFKLPKKSREIFLYLPWRMNTIFPTVKLFSNIDLTTGEKLSKPLFVDIEIKDNLEDRTVFNGGIVLDKSKGVLLLGAQEVPLRRFVTTRQLKDGKNDVTIQNIYKEGGLTLLFAKSYNRFFVLDEEMFRSLYIQMFFLENYDEDLFEPVVMSPWAKVFRIKL